MTNLLLYQRIAQQLAEDIRRGVYQPGERVPVGAQAQYPVERQPRHRAAGLRHPRGPGTGSAPVRNPASTSTAPLALTAPTLDIARVERPGLVTAAASSTRCSPSPAAKGIPARRGGAHLDYLPVRALHQQLAKVTRFQSPRAFS